MNHCNCNPINSVKHCGVDPNAWEDLASDCPAWRNKVHSGAMEFEKQRKERACNPPPPGQQ